VKKDEGKFFELPGAEMGKVVVRFPPEASGSSSVETYFGLYMEVDSNILIFRLRVIKLIFPQY
jgi:hypothetical protein